MGVTFGTLGAGCIGNDAYRMIGRVNKSHGHVGGDSCAHQKFAFEGRVLLQLEGGLTLPSTKLALPIPIDRPETQLVVVRSHEFHGSNFRRCFEDEDPHGAFNISVHHSTIPESDFFENISIRDEVLGLIVGNWSRAITNEHRRATGQVWLQWHNLWGVASMLETKLDGSSDACLRLIDAIKSGSPDIFPDGVDSFRHRATEKRVCNNIDHLERGEFLVHLRGPKDEVSAVRVKGGFYRLFVLLIIVRQLPFATFGQFRCEARF